MSTKGVVHSLEERGGRGRGRESSHLSSPTPSPPTFDTQIKHCGSVNKSELQIPTFAPS